MVTNLDRPPVQVVAAVLCNSKHEILVVRRGPGLDEGFWEFPGGKREHGEKCQLQTLQRELREELGILTKTEHFQFIGANTHVYNERTSNTTEYVKLDNGDVHIHLHLWALMEWTGQIRLLENQRAKLWVTIPELVTCEWRNQLTAASRPLVDRLPALNLISPASILRWEIRDRTPPEPTGNHRPCNDPMWGGPCLVPSGVTALPTQTCTSGHWSVASRIRGNSRRGSDGAVMLPTPLPRERPGSTTPATFQRTLDGGIPLNYASLRICNASIWRASCIPCTCSTNPMESSRIQGAYDRTQNDMQWDTHSEQRCSAHPISAGYGLGGLEMIRWHVASVIESFDCQGEPYIESTHMEPRRVPMCMAHFQLQELVGKQLPTNSGFPVWRDMYLSIVHRFLRMITSVESIRNIILDFIFWEDPRVFWSRRCVEGIDGPPTASMRGGHRWTWSQRESMLRQYEDGLWDEVYNPPAGNLLSQSWYGVVGPPPGISRLEDDTGLALGSQWTDDTTGSPYPRSYKQLHTVSWAFPWEGHLYYRKCPSKTRQQTIDPFWSLKVELPTTAPRPTTEDETCLLIDTAALRELYCFGADTIRECGVTSLRQEIVPMNTHSCGLSLMHTTVHQDSMNRARLWSRVPESKSQQQQWCENGLRGDVGDGGTTPVCRDGYKPLWTEVYPKSGIRNPGDLFQMLIQFRKAVWMDDHCNEPPNASDRFGNECYHFGGSLSRNPATDTTQTKYCRFDNIHPQTHDMPLASSYVYNFEDMDNPGHYKLWFVHGAYTEWITSSLAPCYFSDFLEGKDHWGRGTQPTRWIQGATDDVRDFTTHPEYTALRLSVKDLMVKTGRPNSVSRGVHMSMLFDKDPLWVAYTEYTEHDITGAGSTGA